MTACPFEEVTAKGDWGEPENLESAVSFVSGGVGEKLELEALDGCPWREQEDAGEGAITSSTTFP